MASGLPIHSVLPYELLVEIALQFIQDLQPPKQSNPLCQLDSTLRRIFISSPELWCNIHISSRPKSIQLGKLWLDRSAGMPVSLTLRLTSDSEPGLISATRGVAVCTFVRDAAHRIRQLIIFIQDPLAVAYLLRRALLASPMPLLENLVFGGLYVGVFAVGAHNHRSVPLPSESPRLRSLEVDALSGNLIPNLKSLPVFFQLTRLRFFHSVHPRASFFTSELYQCLSEAQQLQILHFDGQSEHYEDLLPFMTHLHEWNQSITLPHLHDLRLENLDSGSLAHLLAHIERPRLQALHPPIPLSLPSDPLIQNLFSSTGIEPGFVSRRENMVDIAVAVKPAREYPGVDVLERWVAYESIRANTEDERAIRVFSFVTTTPPPTYDSFIHDLATFTHTDPASIKYTYDLTFTMDAISGKLSKCPLEACLTSGEEWEDQFEDWAPAAKLAYHPDVPDVFVFVGRSDGNVLEGTFIGGQRNALWRARDALLIKDLASGMTDQVLT